MKLFYLVWLLIYSILISAAIKDIEAYSTIFIICIELTIIVLSSAYFVKEHDGLLFYLLLYFTITINAIGDIYHPANEGIRTTCSVIFMVMLFSKIKRKV